MPGGNVFGIFSSGSLRVMEVGTEVPIAGVGVGRLDPTFLVIDLCVAMSDAFMTSSWSPPWGQFWNLQTSLLT